MSPACVYCGRDAGEYDEHDECRERAIRGYDPLEDEPEHDVDPQTGAPAPDPDSLHDRDR